MTVCVKVRYARRADAQAAVEALNGNGRTGKLHVYACQVCAFTWHIGHKNHHGAAETRRRGRRHWRQREQMQYQRWEDDGGRALPVWGETLTRPPEER